MKRIISSIAALALAIMAVGCASDLQDKQNAALSAGFKVITPSKPDQVALLPTLPADKVTRITYQGKIYFVLPDVKNNQAYVGGPTQYENYRQIRAQQQITEQNQEAAQLNEVAAMTNWGAWGGWGMVGPMGGYGGFRR